MTKFNEFVYDIFEGKYKGTGQLAVGAVLVFGALSYFSREGCFGQDVQSRLIEDARIEREFSRRNDSEYRLLNRENLAEWVYKTASGKELPENGLY